MKDEGVWRIELQDERYPELLKQIPDPPAFLYAKGTLLSEDSASVAIVGTRSATPYGLQVARELAGELARAGLTIISGLAEGIDGAAHEGALEVGGRTIAVLGHGLNHLFPSVHRELSERVVTSGALLSEFPMELPPLRNNFPQRNRVIAGLSLGVIVVEAPVRSGALITARIALDQGREVFAVPGPISSRVSEGTHRLLKDGAKLVENAQDVVEELSPHLMDRLGVWKKKGLKPVSLSPQETVVYEAVPIGIGILPDRLKQNLNVSAGEFLSVLTSLEIQGLIRQVPGKGYTRI